jgi:hypothetical protein
VIPFDTALDFERGFLKIVFEAVDGLQGLRRI